MLCTRICATLGSKCHGPVTIDASRSHRHLNANTAVTELNTSETAVTRPQCTVRLG